MFFYLGPTHTHKFVISWRQTRGYWESTSVRRVVTQMMTNWCSLLRSAPRQVQTWMLCMCCSCKQRCVITELSWDSVVVQSFLFAPSHVKNFPLIFPFKKKREISTFAPLQVSDSLSSFMRGSLTPHGDSVMDGQSLLVPDLRSTRACFQGDKDDVSQQCEQQHWPGIFSLLRRSRGNMTEPFCTCWS